MAEVKFNTAFKYPFNRAKGMWNILWMLVPIIGWFALGGYGVRIVKEFIKGKFKKLPIFNFSSDLELGFFMFIKAIPFVIAYAVLTGMIGIVSPEAKGLTEFFLQLFVLPVLGINFFKKETVASFFEFKILKSVFNNLGDYVMALFKSILLCIIFLFMCLILVGIPALTFTQNIFLADFYRRNVSKKK